jgi:hypothetical protein
MGGQADKNLREFEPEPKCPRQIIASDGAKESPMFAYELIGLGLVVLFFAALVTDNPNVASR